MKYKYKFREIQWYENISTLKLDLNEKIISCWSRPNSHDFLLIEKSTPFHSKIRKFKK